MVEELQEILRQLKELREEMRTLGEKLESQETAVTEHPHVFASSRMHQGEPSIRGTAITVRTIVERTRLGDSVEEIVEAYPFLSPAQVHDALAYYYDHVNEVEQYINENREALWRIQAQASS